MLKKFASFILIFTACAPIEAKIYLHAPDGREVELKEGTPQPDISLYRSPLETKIASRRFVTNDEFYLANEEFLTGSEFFVDAVEAGFPVAHWPQFQWVTAMESYWYSRYTLDWAASRAHLGIAFVHGPYWTLKARELYDKNRINRDRGERVPANKGVLLSHYMPLFYRRTGLPRFFDDAGTTYLNFTSGDPHFIAPVISADDYHDPISGKKGGWGMPRYWMDYFNTRWSRDKMDKTIDLGGTAQAALKQALWVQYFWHSDHLQKSKTGDEWGDLTLLGNDAEEGFRGIALSLAAFNTLLETKAALFSDIHGHLGGIDPMNYDPNAGLRYIPHSISPNLALLSDLPERPWSFHVKDATSRLWDQASWIWLCATYYHLTQAFERAFTANPPVDGGILEKESGQVAVGLTSVLLKNIKAMHLQNGKITSLWTPRSGTGERIALEDASLLIVALQNAIERFAGESALERQIRDEARTLLKIQADFLLSAQAPDGSFYPDYLAANLKGSGSADLSAPLFWGVRGLLAAWQSTKDENYLKAAYASFNRLNEKFWDERSGLYRTKLGDDTVVLTPKELGAAIGAMREISFAAERSKLRAILERFTRFWVQALDVSGMQMAENYQTGEVHYGVGNPDEDSDGIRFAGGAHGRYGIAPVAAGKVYVNLAEKNNPSFSQLHGEPFRLSSQVRCAYKPDQEPSFAKLKLETIPSITSISRTSGYPSLTAQLQTEPRRSDSKLSGAEIFKLNCAVCHGERGQGITGKSLAEIAKEGGMEPVIVDGRPMQRMPHWGNVLSSEEIARVVAHIKQLFQK